LGGTAFPPGSLNISGPVTAEISGPIEVEGSVSITGTPTVGISGTVAVDLAPGSTVEISGTPTVDISGTVDVQFPAAQDVIVNSGSVSVSNTVATTVANNVSVENAAGGSLTVAGEVNIGNTPAVTIDSGSVTAIIDGTPTIELAAGSEIEINNASLDIVGAGGFILSGNTASIFANAETVSVAPGANVEIVSNANVTTFNSLNCGFFNFANSSTSGNAAICVVVLFEWLSSGGIFIGEDVVSFIIGSSTEYWIPCKGAAVNISITNFGSVGTISTAEDNIIIDGNARSIDHLIVTGYAPSATTFTGFTLKQPTQPASLANGWVSNVQITDLTAGDLFVIPLVPYNGEVSGFYQVVTDALDNDAVVIDLSIATVEDIIPGTGNNGLILNLPSAIQASPVDVSFFAPPTQLALVIKPSSASGTVFLSLTGQG
jgi:hypothetical protein